MFNDMHNICKRDSNELCTEYGAAPYCSQGFVEHMANTRGDPHWDTWSVAVVILEILVGSEFLVLAKTHESILWLLHHAEPYIDQELYSFLEEMLNDGFFDKASAFVQKSNDNNSIVILESVRKMCVVVKEVGGWVDKLALYKSLQG